MRVLVFGDSITQGFYGSHGGWVGLLIRYYQKHTLKDLRAEGEVQVFNLGISGNTAEDVLDRIDAETTARTNSNHETVIVLAIGTVDSKLRNNVAVSDVYAFQETYEALIKKAQKLADNIVCVGLSAVDEKLSNPWVYSTDGEQLLNNRLNLFEDTIKQSALRLQVPFVPVHDRFLKALENGQDLLVDGLHPNDAGHKMIAELVKPALDKPVT